MRDVKNRSWSTDQVNTGQLLYTCPTGYRLAIVYVCATVGGGAANIVDVTVGLHPTTIAAPTVNDWTGVANLAFTHAGVAKAGGGIGGPSTDSALCMGAGGDDIRLTNTDPGGDELRVTVHWIEIELEP